MKIALKAEFAESQNDNQSNRINKIKPKDRSNIFPEIHKVFRRKGNNISIDNLKFYNNDAHLLNRVNINPQSVKLNNDKKYIIDDEQYKTNLISAHFERINNNIRENHLEKERLYALINQKINNLKDEINIDKQFNRTSINFSENNIALNSTSQTTEKQLK